MTKGMYFEDYHEGLRLDFGSHVVDREEMFAFARQWDSLPIHVEEATTTGYQGGVIASGVYTMAVKQRLVSRHPLGEGVIGAIGHDELRFRKPVRAGDELTLSAECIDLRPSMTKADRGIVKLKMRMRNQNKEVVLAYIDIVMIAKRAG